MDVNIKVLDIGDGDAIIVHLKKENSQLVFLIDGGRMRNFELVRDELDKTLQHADRQAPDFILCTHYDDDHIGGLGAILEYYQEHRPKLWMFRTTDKIDIEELRKTISRPVPDESIFPSESDTYAGGTTGSDSDAYQIAIKNVEQEQKLGKLADSLGIECVEPLAENFKIDGWPELEVISPNIQLYEKLFPKKFDISELLKETVQQLKDNEEKPTEKTTSTNPFENMDNTTKSKITPTNTNSAMLLLSTDGKKFLFAADAGLQSFSHIPSEKLEKLYWLKVPHHGSINNLDSALIKKMAPEHAVISGKHHISQLVIDCFNAVGTNIKTTKDNGNILFEYTIKNSDPNVK